MHIIDIVEKILNPFAASDHKLRVGNNFTLTNIRMKNTNVNGTKMGIKNAGLARDVNLYQPPELQGLLRM